MCNSHDEQQSSQRGLGRRSLNAKAGVKLSSAGAQMKVARRAGRPRDNGEGATRVHLNRTCRLANIRTLPRAGLFQRSSISRRKSGCGRQHLQHLHRSFTMQGSPREFLNRGRCLKSEGQRMGRRPFVWSFWPAANRGKWNLYRVLLSYRAGHNAPARQSGRNW